MRKDPAAKRWPPYLTPVLLALCLIMAGACSRFDQSVRISPHGSAITEKSAAIGGFADFRRAFANFDFSGVIDGELDVDSRALMRGMRLVMDGDMAAAESKFRELAVAARDAWSRAIAAEILVQLYYFQSKWKSLHTVFGPVSGRKDTAEDSELPFRELSLAFAENFSFPERPVILPLKLSSSGTPVIRLQINGEWERFWLDTGSGFTVLASDLADKLKIFPLNRTRAQAGTGTNKRVAARLTVIETLRIGDLEIRHHPAMIVQKKDLFFRIPGLFQRRKIMKNTGVSGILGMNAIKNLRLRIDYRKGRIIIGRPAHLAGGARNFFWLGYPILICRSQDGVLLHFGLDTGAKHSVISSTIFAKIRPAETYRMRLKVWGAGGEMKIRTQVLPRLKIIAAGHLLEFKDIVSMPLNQFGFVSLDGVLGNDFFSGCGSLAIDLSSGVFALENGL